MDFKYEIPQHLEGFISNIPEDQLNMLVTFLFEFAIHHRMLEYPRTEIENEVINVRQLCLDIKEKQHSELAIITQLLVDISSKLDSREQPMIRIPSFIAKEKVPEKKTEPEVTVVEENLSADAGYFFMK
jgi:hypothetical protein